MKEKELPGTGAQWKNDPLICTAVAQTIHNYDNPLSASKINRKQFLLLQVLWRKARSDEGFVKPPGDSLVQRRFYDEAKEKLNGAKFWDSYLRSFGKNRTSDLEDGRFPEIGTFALVRQFQVECQGLQDIYIESTSRKFTPVAKRTRGALREQQSPTPTFDSDLEEIGDLTLGSSPRFSPESTASAPYVFVPAVREPNQQAVKDEQIVNTALILFLRAVTMHYDTRAHWSLHRHKFKLGEIDEEIFEARVDGYLRSLRDDQVKAIIEVKPFPRIEDRSGIRMQEGAQMAAWISNYPDKNPEPERTFR